MASLLEYFKTDFAAMTLDYQISISTIPDFTIERRVGIEAYSYAKFIAYYIPRAAEALGIATLLLSDSEKAITESNDIEIISGTTGDTHIGIPGTVNAAFGRRLFLYTETDFSPEELAYLDAQAKAGSLWVTVRGPEYARQKSAEEKPLAFILHDSQDRDATALKIAQGLHKLACPVWYGDYTLERFSGEKHSEIIGLEPRFDAIRSQRALGAGDSLRDRLESGLAVSDTCILIVSDAFLSNPGWTKSELDALLTKEFIEGDKLLVPVWLNVSQEKVAEYSTILAHHKAIKGEIGDEEINRKLYVAVHQDR